MNTTSKFIQVDNKPLIQQPNTEPEIQPTITLIMNEIQVTDITRFNRQFINLCNNLVYIKMHKIFKHCII